MNVFKKIGIAIAVLIAIPLVAALFIEKSYTIERDIEINQPKEKVFSYVRKLKNQEKFSKWVLMDPEMKKEFRGEDGDVGFVYAWDGEIAGKGEQKIVRIVEGERVDMTLHFIKPFESNATSAFITEAVSGNKTKIRWGMQGNSIYPFNIMNLFLGDVLGNDLDLSLRKLKEVLEK